MSEHPDLSQIQPRAATPSETPDQRTESELKQLAKAQKKTPTLLTQEAHSDHQQTLRGYVEIHRTEKITAQSECKELQRKLDEERQNLLTRLDAEKEKNAELRVRNARLEEVGSAATWMNVLGTIFTIAGGSLLSYAGASPGLEENTKTAYSNAGLGLAAAGVLFIVAGAIKWVVSKPAKETTSQAPTTTSS